MNVLESFIRFLKMGPETGRDVDLLTQIDLIKVSNTFNQEVVSFYLKYGIYYWEQRLSLYGSDHRQKKLREM